MIVPVYKTEETLPRCVDSLRNQTLKDIEIILVDDGSPDRCGILCDEYAKADSRIRVIHKKNGGSSSVRNVGMEAVTTKYLTFCDSDDYVSLDWCQWMQDAMNKGNIHMTICGVESEFPDGRIVHQGVMPTRVAGRSEFLQMAPDVSLYITCNKLFKTELIKRHGLRFDERIYRCEDADFTLRYMKLMGPDERITYGSGPLYHYIRYNENSLSRSYMKNLWSAERNRLKKTLALLECFGFSEEEYADFYSTKAAYSISDAIANVFCEMDATFLKMYRELDEIVSSPEFEAAVTGSGMSQVAGGVYLKLLQQKHTFLIYLYGTLSNLKKRYFGGKL